MAVSHVEKAVGYENKVTISLCRHLAELYRKNGRTEDALNILDIITPVTETILNRNDYKETLLLSKIYAERFEVFYSLKQYDAAKENALKAAKNMGYIFSTNKGPQAADYFINYLLYDVGVRLGTLGDTDFGDYISP